MTDSMPPASPHMDGDEDGLTRAPLDAADGRPRPRLPAALAGPALRRLWRLSGVVAGAALIVILIAALAPHISLPAPRRPPIPYTALAVSEALASCMSGAAWSPDGRRVAAILTPSCLPPDTQTTPTPSDLLIFDAATGKQVAAYDLATATRAALVANGGGASAAAAFISYYDARWSPDGGVIAVLLSAFGAAGGVTGVALVAVSGAARGHVRALLGDLNPTLSYPASAFAPFPVDRWDLRDNAHSMVYLTPALAYRWLPDDTLVGAEPLGASGAAPPSGSVGVGGDPIGGQVFNMWQWGTISPVIATTCGGNGVVVDPLPQPYALLYLATPVWSPDGRYLLYVSVQGRLSADTGRPAPASIGSSPCDYGSPPDQLPRAPLHDGGLRSALGLLDAHGNTQLSLVWSPDGRRLAVMTDALALGKGTLLIYDTASGKPISSFDSSQFEAQVARYALVTNAAWSPDSRSLLLTITRPAPRLIILRPAALGG